MKALRGHIFNWQGVWTVILLVILQSFIDIFIFFGVFDIYFIFNRQGIYTVISLDILRNFIDIFIFFGKAYEF